MKNFISAYYKERSNKSNIRDDVHIGHMGCNTVTSHSAICEFQEKIVSVETMCDDVFDDPDNDELKQKVLDECNFGNVETKNFYKHMKQYHTWLRKQEEEIIETVTDMCNAEFDDYGSYSDEEIDEESGDSDDSDREKSE